MRVVYLFISYLIVALLLPTIWALWPTWRKARTVRQVTCPALGASALVSIDRWYAVRMHALGNSELRVKNCSQWPECRDCDRNCLAQIGTAA